MPDGLRDLLAALATCEATRVVIVSGRPIAELRPLPRRALDAATLLERWRHLPSVDPKRLRADVDDVLEASLQWR